MVKCEHVQILVLLVHDFNWVAKHPMVGLPAMCIGICLQARIMVKSYVVGGVSFWNQLGMLGWFIGNDIWTCGEYLWDSDKPAGILADFKFFENIDVRWYTVVMAVATSIQTTTVVGLLGFYLYQLLSVVTARACSCLWSAPTVLPEITTATPLALAQQADPNAVAVERGCEEETPEVNVHLAGLSISLEVYCQLFTLPWIMMDTGWICCNFLDIVKLDGHTLQFVTFNVVVGCIAIVIQADCVRRRYVLDEPRETVAALAELLWLGGNLVWMYEDLLLDTPLMFHTAIVFFFTGCVAIIWCICTSCPWPFSCRGSRARALVSPSTPVAICRSFHWPFSRRDARARAVTSPSTPVANVEGSPGVVDVCVSAAISLSDPVKIHKRTKKKEPWIDPDEVGKHLRQWHERLPRVHPFYSIGQQADLTVVQILHQNQCGFACTTPSEISLALSAGIPPEDIIFHAPFKLKSHLNYLKEMKICMMSFDDDVGLQKIAHEFPTAHLLLQVIISEEAGCVRHPRVRVGATRDMWAPLLGLATKLHLHVVGISFQSSSGFTEAWAFEEAFRTAQQIFNIAADNGHCMNTLDLGNIVIAHNAFENFTDSINKQLGQWFPAEIFPDFRVFAELGQFLVPDVCDHGKCVEGLNV